MKGDIDARLAMGIVVVVLLGAVLGLGCGRQAVAAPGVSLEWTEGMDQTTFSAVDAPVSGVEPGKVLAAFVNAFF